MKKWIAILLAVLAFLIYGCAEEPEADNTEPSTAETMAQPKEYPGNSEIATFGQESFVCEELFNTSAEENGQHDVLFQFFGIVEKYVQDEATGVAFLKINTAFGDAVVQDPIYYFERNPDQGYSDAELERMREYYPIPEVGEFVHIYAEYQDTIDDYGGPLFTYGGRDYFVKVVMATEDPPGGDAPAQESTTPTEKPSAGGTTTEQQNAGKTETPPATEGVTTTPTTPQPTEPAATQPKETTPVATEPVATEPLGNTSKAIEKAKSYLRSVSLSRAGMIRQLEYEGFSNEEAIYGADYCGADWNEQAIKKAKSYLGSTAFSYSGLIGQLEYEGFTNAEAVYGADNSGADWNEQAKLKAASYLSKMSFTRDSLIYQLEYEGFTHAQAVYGVEANGL